MGDAEIRTLNGSGDAPWFAEGASVGTVVGFGYQLEVTDWSREAGRDRRWMGVCGQEKLGARGFIS